MEHKTVPLTGIKTSDLGEGEFEGWASTFGNTDHQGDRVMPGAFVKSLASGRPVPLLWMHRSEDPRSWVGEVVEASEVSEGLKIRGKLDVDTEHGAAAYRQIKARRVAALSIGYQINTAVKGSDGVNELRDLDLVEISVVPRGANTRALIGAVKSAGQPTAPIRSALARATVERYHQNTKGVPPMFDSRLETLTKDRDSQVALVKTILDTADELQRDLTADEAKRVDEATKKAKDIDTAIAREKADLDVLAQAKAMSAEIGGVPTTKPGEEEHASGEHLAMSGKHAKTMARKVIAAMPRDPSGTKALASGVTTTSVIMLPEVQELGRPPQSILDVLLSRQVSVNYSFLQQTVRTNNAAPVAEGSAKPVSVYTVDEVPATLQVIAHVSEQIPHYTLSDNANLEQFVTEEMMHGLRVTVENQVLNGNGTAPNLRGILNTSGIQTQAFDTDILTTIRKAITKLENQGLPADVLAISAADWESLELTAATAGALDYRGIPLNATERRLWGVQAVVSTTLPASTAVLLERQALSVDTDGNLDTRWSDAVNDDFSRNFVRCRVESRFGVSAYRPTGVVSIDTAA